MDITPRRSARTAALSSNNHTPNSTGGKKFNSKQTLKAGPSKSGKQRKLTQFATSKEPGSVSGSGKSSAYKDPFQDSSDSEQGTDISDESDPMAKSRSGKQKTVKKTVQKDLPFSSIDYDCPILTEISGDNVDIKSTAQVWLDTYYSLHEDAIKSFVNLTLRIAGCPGSIEVSELYSRINMEKSLDRLRVLINKTKDCPPQLVSSKNKSEKNILNYALQFVKSVVKNGGDMLIFGSKDTEIDSSFKKYYFNLPNSVMRYSLFFSIIGNWLETLSTNEYRPFRQAGTIVIFNIQSSIATIKKSIRDGLTIVRRQILDDENRSAQKKSSKPKKSARRVQLEEREAEFLLQDKILSERCDMILEKTVQFRHRDVYPPIRAECVHYIADWISKDPPSFLKTNYLRYFGWLWHDRDEKVRLAAVENVRNIMSIDNTIAPMLRGFFERFGPRLLQLSVADSDNNVMVAAIKLSITTIQLGMLNITPAKIQSAISQINKKNVKDLHLEKKDAKKTKKVAKSKNKKSKLSQSFSQQLLYESDKSSDSESENDESRNENNEERADIDRAEQSPSMVICIPDSDIDPTNPEGQTDGVQKDAVKYLAPLIVHSLPSVRSAAGTLVYQWLSTNWAQSMLSELNLSGEPSNEKEPNQGFYEKCAIYKSVAAFLSLLESTPLPESAGNNNNGNNFSYKGDLDKSQICLSDDPNTIFEKKWNEARVFLHNLSSSETQKLNFLPEIETGFGLDSSWIIAASNSLYSKSPFFQDVDALMHYISMDHSSVPEPSSQTSSMELDSKLVLSPEQEFALLRAVLVWVGTQKASLYTKSKNLNNKVGLSSINTQLQSFYSGFSKWANILFQRYRDQPKCLECLLAIACYGLSPQIYLENGTKEDLKNLSNLLTHILERKNNSVIVTQFLVYLLGQIDDSLILDMENTKIELSTSKANNGEELMEVEQEVAEISGDSESSGSMPYLKEYKPKQSIGNFISTSMKSAFNKLVVNLRDIDVLDYENILDPLVIIRSIIYDRNAIEQLEEFGNIIEAVNSFISSTKYTVNPVFELFLNIYNQDSSTSIKSEFENFSVKALNISGHILNRMVAWKFYYVNSSILKLHSKALQNPRLSFADSETDVLISKAKMLINERDALLEACKEKFSKEEENIHLKITSLLISSNVYILFSTSTLNLSTTETVAVSDTISSINKLKDLIILTISFETQNAWIMSLSNIFSLWVTTILPWALLIDEFDPKDSQRMSDISNKQQLASYYFNLKNSIYHNGYISDLAKSISTMIEYGVFSLAFISKLASYVGKMGSEIILREYEKKVPKSLLSDFNSNQGSNLAEENMEVDLENTDGGTSMKKQDDHSSKGFISTKFFGFVAQSSFDNSVQKLFYSLKGAAVSATLQGFVLKEFMRSLQQNFELCVTTDLVLKRPGSLIYYNKQLSILPKIISSVLRSTSTDDNNVSKKNIAKTAMMQFGKPSVCSLWATLHKAVIKYGFDIVEMCCLESISTIVDMIDKEDAQNQGKKQKNLSESKNVSLLRKSYERCTLWYGMLASVVSGLILPKHAKIIKDALLNEGKNVNKDYLSSRLPVNEQLGNDDINENKVPEDSASIRISPESLGDKLLKEYNLAANQPYIKALDEQINRLVNVKSRLLPELQLEHEGIDILQSSNFTRPFIEIESPMKKRNISDNVGLLN
ncbi:hypothetical protein BB560_003072 [Smittium megazygosporum]|uniref:SCD domain-containing protein n=1 Tax=Smittium megazygosporum TaxID=133381 RepID=A0A2T9ZCZ8_9FUNG|nr:hypothetical protein BB560_003072 [Smittium megazygosporum]